MMAIRASGRGGAQVRRNGLGGHVCDGGFECGGCVFAGDSPVHGEAILG